MGDRLSSALPFRGALPPSSPYLPVALHRGHQLRPSKLSSWFSAAARRPPFSRGFLFSPINGRGQNRDAGGVESPPACFRRGQCRPRLICVAERATREGSPLRNGPPQQRPQSEWAVRRICLPEVARCRRCRGPVSRTMASGLRRLEASLP